MDGDHTGAREGGRRSYAAGMLAVRVGIAVTWCNAWLAEAVSLDEAAAQVATVTGRGLVSGVPQEQSAVTWPVAMGRLRAAGATTFSLSLPVPGDPLGLAGPAAFNAAAITAGVAVLVDGAPTAYGLIPSAGDAGVWDLEPVSSPPVLPTVGEASRQLSEAVSGATDELERLDVAHGHPRARASLAAATRLLAAHPPAPGPSQRADSLLVSAARLLALLEVAVSTDGATVTANEARLRLGSLRPVDTAARRALVAACSEPPPVLGAR
jgi:hypothetical protein